MNDGQTIKPQKCWFYDAGYSQFGSDFDGDWTDTGTITNGDEILYVRDLQYNEDDERLIQDIIDCLNAKEMRIQELEAELAMMKRAILKSSGV